MPQNADHRRRPKSVGELLAFDRGDQDVEGLGQRHGRIVPALFDAVEFSDRQHGVDFHRRVIITANQLLQEIEHQASEMIVNLSGMAVRNGSTNPGDTVISFVTSPCNDQRGRK